MVLIRFRSTTLVRTASFLFAFLLIDCIVSGQNFDDVFETSVTRSPTHRPTVSPTAVPTASPTFSPTVSPTASPTFSPTVSPTSSPSASPTFFPTLSPTAAPTRPPTITPSEAPTTAPTIEETVSSMSLFPQMTFYTILEKDGISTEEIGQLFSDLLIGVVEEINSTYDYLYTRTALNVVVSAPDRGSGSGAYRITIDGVIYYFDEVPATETLAHSLNVYFSLWGSSNLENYLLSNGLEKASVVSVDIGEESIDFYDRQNYEDGRQNIFINQEGELSKRNIVGFYILFLVVAITIVLLVYRIRLGRRRKLKREITTSQRSYTESSTSYRSEQNEDEDEENGIAAQEHSNDVVGRISTDMQQQSSTTTTMEQSIAAKSTKPPSSSDESDTKTVMKPDGEEPSPSRNKKKKSTKKKRKDKKPSKKPKKSKNLEEQIENDVESGESKIVGSKSDGKPETEAEVSNGV